MRATGTDDGLPEPAASIDCGVRGDASDSAKKARQKCRQSERESARHGAASRTVASATATPSGARKSLTDAEKGDAARQSAACARKATGGTRTLNLRFTKPLLCQLSYGGELSNLLFVNELPI